MKYNIDLSELKYRHSNIQFSEEIVEQITKEGIYNFKDGYRIYIRRDIIDFTINYKLHRENGWAFCHKKTYEKYFNFTFFLNSIVFTKQNYMLLML